MWDLEDTTSEAGTERTEHIPIGYASKSKSTHMHGVTGLSFYPFDSLAFLSSSYDHSLKVFDSTTLTTSASFQLSSVVYTHAMSPVAHHLLVACAVQHPAVRLVDLKSGAATHTLTGHSGGAVLSLAWSPRDEHILATGASDGAVRFWDIRRSAGTLGVLDNNDSIGVTGYDGRGLGARNRHRGKAHSGAVNGITWTEDSRFVVTSGHDERIRVWDITSGANTLASFGPVVRNRKLATLTPLVAPQNLTRNGEDILFFPNPKEILQFDLLEGQLQKRLRPMRVAPNDKSQVSSIAWRAHHVELLSAHSDGSIRSWQPRTVLDEVADEQERLGCGDQDQGGEHIRKRARLDEIQQELTAPQITWT